LKTLEEVFIHNLKRYRGKRTQAEIAEAAGIPLRSYQHAEGGAIPQGPNRAAIAEALGVQETELFLDPDLTSPTPRQALEVIAKALGTQLPNQTFNQRDRIVAGAETKDSSQQNAETISGGNQLSRGDRTKQSKPNTRNPDHHVDLSDDQDSVVSKVGSSRMLRADEPEPMITLGPRSSMEEIRAVFPALKEHQLRTIQGLLKAIDAENASGMSREGVLDPDHKVRKPK
jgi:transcriptional regulator with XRE-family HTH domain